MDIVQDCVKWSALVIFILTFEILLRKKKVNKYVV